MGDRGGPAQLTLQPGQEDPGMGGIPPPSSGPTPQVLVHPSHPDSMCGAMCGESLPPLISPTPRPYVVKPSQLDLRGAASSQGYPPTLHPGPLPCSSPSTPAQLRGWGQPEHALGETLHGREHQSPLALQSSAPRPPSTGALLTPPGRLRGLYSGNRPWTLLNSHSCWL